MTGPVSVTYRTFAHGREPNWRNLMIQYGVEAMFTDPADLKILVER